MKEDSRLSHLCLLQLLISSLKHDISNTISENIISLFKKFFCERVAIVKILTHSYKLCSLSGKNKCFHFFCFFINNDNLFTVFKVQNYDFFLKDAPFISFF